MEKRTSLATVVGSSLIGTTIEFYDFFIYGTAAALVFPHLFFPTLSPVAGLMAAYATLAIPFLTRPIGAVLFGHYGDRLGRKKMLIVALLIMGLSTFAIGLVPGYDTIGIWAPILVITCRLLQGFALGGEWGGAATMVIEYAPPEKRGFYGTFVQLGNVIGLFTSALVFAVIPRDMLLAGGWRIPFLISIVALAVGLYIRNNIEETPLFKELKSSGAAVPRVPVMEILRRGKRAVLLAMGVRTGEIILGWLVIGFLLSYATRNLGYNSTQVLYVILAASALDMITVPLAGYLSDRLGRRPVFLFGACVAAVMAFPMFWLVDLGSFPIFLCVVAFAYAFGNGVMFAVQPAFFSEAFDTGVRYTGISLGFQLANIIGGLTPLIGTWLIQMSGGKSWSISLFLLVGSLVTIGCVLSMRETAGRRLETRPVAPAAAED
ncbi:MFS transporter [Rhodovastum atsumiense]|uniref:MFS transporter n=1 Tax=Rhodovastum atsumiense TaxID=504468 RepID=UPI00193AF537|nr:MFS transporter [Rhodovastum atsumiense]